MRVVYVTLMRLESKRKKKSIKKGENSTLPRVESKPGELTEKRVKKEKNYKPTHENGTPSSNHKKDEY